jgi:periplasmic protein TonB
MPATIKSEPVHASAGSGRPEAAPTPAHAAVDAIALTSRDDFLLELGQCLQGTASIAPVESSALALAAAARSRRVQVLLVDSRDLADLRAQVDLLQARAPALTTLVFAGRDNEVEIAAALKGSSVFAVLPLPIDDRKTAAVFEGAVADAKTRRGAANAAATGARTVPAAEPKPVHAHEARTAAAEPEAAAPPPARQSEGDRKTGALALGGLACAAVAAAAAWWLMRDETPEPSGPTPGSATAVLAPDGGAPAIVPPAAIEGNVDELLEKARVAMRERRYLEPAKDSALEYYRSAAQVDPGNAEALAGLNRLRPVIVARFDELTKAGRHDAAAAALAQLESAMPADPSIPDLRLRLASARIAKAIEEKDVQRATELVRAAQGANAIPAAQLAKWRSDISLLNEKVRQEQAVEQQARASAAAEQKAREARAAEAAREAQLARERDEAKKLEAERAQQAALAATKSAEAEANARKVSQRVEPKLKRSVTPDYPSDASNKGIGGVVVVAYTVDVEGRTQDVRVESSQPPEVFDKAAMAAVRRWRYEPATVDGVPTETQMKMTIRFALPK